MSPRRLLIYSLCYSLTFSVSARDVDLAARRAVTDLSALGPFVQAASNCYRELGSSRYRETFCRNNQGSLLNFETINLELADKKDATHALWLEHLDDPTKAPKYMRPILQLVNREYEECRKFEQEYEEGESDYEQGPEDDGEWGDQEPIEGEVELNSLLFNEDEEPGEAYGPPQHIIEHFFPRDFRGAFSMVPGFFNARIAELETYGPVLGDEQSRSRINALRDQALRLRQRMLKENPVLMNYMVGQMEYEGEEEGVFWSSVQESTGLDPREIPAEAKSFNRVLRHFQSTVRQLESEGYVFPENEGSRIGEQASLLTIERRSDGTYHGEYRSNDGEPQPVISDELLASRLGWSGEELSANFEMIVRYTSPLDVHNEDFSAVTELGDRYQTDIREWNVGRDQIIGLYNQKLDESAEEEPAYWSHYSGSGQESTEDPCQNNRETRLRDFTDQATVISLHADPEARQFMESNYNEALELMKGMIDEMNLSPGSKVGMKEILDGVNFDMPQVSLEHWSGMHEEAVKIVDMLQEQELEYYFGPSFDTAMEHLHAQEGYGIYAQLEMFDSANAFYERHGPDHSGHRIGFGCGYLLPSVRGEGADLFLGTLAHELGHALDPGYSTPNRDKYSEETLETINELRACLVEQNQGLFTRLGEDFADHIEAHFLAHSMRATSDDESWPLRRQRLLQFHYSAICEEENPGMASHSHNEYRSRHILSHPYTASEFGEFNLPTIPFCPQLLLPSSGGSSQ